MMALRFRDLPSDPLVLFSRWLQAARETDIRFPEAMALATAGQGGVPAVRMVLLRGFDQRGFRFYTNYQSRKGHDLAENPLAALLFYWEPLGRQVRIQVETERLSEQESDLYFASRPYDNQLSAWASHQSQPVPNRAALEQALESYRSEFGGNVPRPAHWGGFLARPSTYEFWQARSGRLHDRFLYTEDHQGGWRIQRLAP